MIQGTNWLETLMLALWLGAQTNERQWGKGTEKGEVPDSSKEGTEWMCLFKVNPGGQGKENKNG